MEKLYSKDTVFFSEFNNNIKVPYRIFYTNTTSNRMHSYSTQFAALNDYAYFITKTVNDRIQATDNRMKELLDCIQDSKTDKRDVCDLIDLYFGEEEDKNLWLFLTELISINSIIISLLSFCEGTLKEITFDFIKKMETDDKVNITGINSCIEKLKLYDKNNLLKDIEKDISVIKQAKKIRNKFVHEQWISKKENILDFKTRKDLNQISIIDLINAITNLLEVVEKIGIENGVYELNM